MERGKFIEALKLMDFIKEKENEKGTLKQILDKQGEDFINSSFRYLRKNQFGFEDKLKSMIEAKLKLVDEDLRVMYNQFKEI